jgi:HAMP domain-containing protein
MTTDRQIWDALGAIRQALEEMLPAGSVRPADEVDTVEQEVEALVEAIRRVGDSQAGGDEV